MRIKAHWAYFSYLVRHKWFVLLECVRLRIPWQGLVHDWHKFLPDEWFPYVYYFHNPDGSVRQDVDEAFDYAWLLHQRRGRHHWQYYLLVQDEDEDKVLRMPSKYMKEMLADWIGAGKAQGNPDTRAWYVGHKDKMRLHPETRAWIEAELGLCAKRGH